MNSKESKSFKIDWVLKNELAIGPAPTRRSHIQDLKKEEIISILSLCRKDEVAYLEEMEDHFICKRVVLPDHKFNKSPTSEELNQALDTLGELILLGPVFVHCVAAVERSPLICMAWLIRKHNLKIEQALDYLMEIHKGTNPLPIQLKILENL